MRCVRACERACVQRRRRGSSREQFAATSNSLSQVHRLINQLLNTRQASRVAGQCLHTQRPLPLAESLAKPRPLAAPMPNQRRPLLSWTKQQVLQLIMFAWSTLRREYRRTDILLSGRCIRGSARGIFQDGRLREKRKVKIPSSSETETGHAPPPPSLRPNHCVRVCACLDVCVRFSEIVI